MDKKYTPHQIINKYNKLSAKKQVNILYMALDYMQQYNGRTKRECIVLSMEREYGFNPMEE